MPVMGGLEAMAQLTQRFPGRRCRCVAVTADAFEDTRDACLAAGFDGWLTKPFRVEDLVRRELKSAFQCNVYSGIALQHTNAVTEG
jgi:CheY-like chemotaxis protein